MAKLSEWAFTHGLIFAFQRVEAGGKVTELANELDVIIDRTFGEGSDRIQLELVKRVLLPLARELMKETPGSYAALLKKEYDYVVDNKLV